MIRDTAALFATFGRKERSQNKRAPGKTVTLGHRGDLTDAAFATVVPGRDQSAYTPRLATGIDCGNVLR